MFLNEKELSIIQEAIDNNEIEQVDEEIGACSECDGTCDSYCYTVS